MSLQTSSPINDGSQGTVASKLHVPLLQDLLLRRFEIVDLTLRLLHHSTQQFLLFIFPVHRQRVPNLTRQATGELLGFNHGRDDYWLGWFACSALHFPPSRGSSPRGDDAAHIRTELCAQFRLQNLGGVTVSAGPGTASSMTACRWSCFLRGFWGGFLDSLGRCFVLIVSR